MKKRLYPITIAILALTTLGLSSCLKDSKNYIDVAKSAPLVELPLAAYGTGFFQAEAYDITSTPQNLPLVVNLAAPKPLSTALKVTLALDQKDLDAYNTANGTSFTILPVADYSVSSWSVTIPANQNEATMNIQIHSNLIDPSQQYVLPIKIADAGGQQISNYGYILFNVQVKNKYDGVYTVTGTSSYAPAPSLTADLPEDVQLITAGANSVYYYDIPLGGPAISIAGHTSYFGGFAPLFSFDANSDVVDVTNYYGQNSGSHVRSGVLDPTGQNKFISGTPGQVGSKFQVSFIMQNAGTNAGFFNFTFTYKGPR